MITRLLSQLESHSDAALHELDECNIMLLNTPHDGFWKNRKIGLNKLIFDNEQAILDVYQKYQKLIFAHPVSETEALEVKHDLSQIDKHKADLNEDLIVEKLDRLSQMIEDTKTSLPSEFVKVWDENLKLQKKSSVTGKFKLVIPIIPKIFTYEKEMPYNLVEEFKQMRKDFKNGHYFLYPKTI